MNRLLRSALASLVAIVSIGAAADPGDQVIMRRVIGSPATGGEVPIPITYYKVPTQAVVTADAVPAANGTLSVSTAVQGVQCTSKRSGVVDSKFCDSVADKLPVGTFQLPARVSRALHVVQVDPSQIAAIGSVTNVDQLCSSTATLDGSVWGISCDAHIFDNQFVKVPTIASPVGASFPLADGNLAFDTASAGVVCRQVSTGDQVVMSECASAPTPSNVGIVKVAAKGSSDLHVLAFSLGSLQAIVPSITNGDALCSGSATVNGQVWKLRCDQDALRVHYKRQATHVELQAKSLAAPSVAQPNFTDTVTADTSKNALCIDTDTGKAAADATSCAFLAADPTVGTFPISATFSPQLHAVLVDPSAVTTIAPTVTDAQALCSSTVGIQYPSSSQSWKTTCSPEDVRVHYVKVPTVALPQSVYATGQSANYDGSLSFSTDGAGVRCVDTDTQQDADASKCAYVTTPNVGTISSAATFSPQLRTIWFDSASLKAQVPAITNLDALCAGTTIAYYPTGGNGASQAWKLTCSKDDVRVHFVKGGTFLTPNVFYSPLSGPTSSGGATFTGTMTFSSAAQGVTCTDTDTNLPVDVSKCAYISSPSVSTAIPASVSFAPAYRKAYIAKSALQALLPTATNVDALCAGGAFSFGFSYNGYPVESWSLTCDATDMKLHYKKVPTTITLNASSTFSNYQSTVGVTNLSGTVYANTSASGVICRDTDTNSTVDASLCAYAANPTNVSTSLAIGTGTFSPFYRKVMISKASLLAAVPEATNADALCAASAFTINRQTGYGSEAWTVTCNPDDVRLHYVKVPTFVSINTSSVFSGSTSTTGLANTGGILYGNTAASGVICRDTDSGSTVDPSICVYGPNPASISTSLALGSTVFSPLYRKAYIARTSLQTAVPEASNLDAICASSGLIVARLSGYGSEAWTVTCNADDVRAHYVKVPTHITWPAQSAYYAAVGYSYSSIGHANFGYAFYGDTSTSGVICRDTDNGSTVSSSLCAYAPTPSTITTSISLGSATYSPFYRKIYLSRASIAAAVPEADDVDAFCGGLSIPVSVGYTNETWTTTCNADDVRVHYVKVPTHITWPAQSAYYAAVGYSYSSTGHANFAYAFYGDTSTAGVICRDTDSGSTVSASVCAYAPVPATISTQISLGSATYSPFYRKIYLPRASIAAAVTEADDVDAFCAGLSIPVSVGYTNETWTTTCNADDVRVHYVKVPTHMAWLTQNAFYNAFGNIGSSSGRANFAYAFNVDTSTTGVICRDSDTGSSVSTSVCAYAPVPSSISASLSLGNATYSPLYRKIYMDRSVVSGVVPEADDIDAFCGGVPISMYVGNGNSETWTTTCNADDIRAHYVKVPTTASINPTSYYYNVYGSGLTTTATYPNVVVSSYFTLNTAAAGVICRDTDTGATVSSTLCNYAAAPANMSASLTVGNVTFSPFYRRVLLDPTAISKILPDDPNVTDLCSSTMTVNLSGRTETWNATCNAEDIRVHYVKVATQVAPNGTSYYYNTYGSNLTTTAGLPNVSSSAFSVNTSASGVICRNSDDGTTVDSSVCVNAPLPSTISAGLSVGAVTFSPLYRKVYVARSTMTSLLPDATNIDAFCIAPVSINLNGRSESWSMTCDPENVRVHYSLLPTAFNFRANSSVYSGTGSTSVFVGYASLGCVDSDTSSIVDSGYCTYAQQTSGNTLTGTYNASAKTVTVSASDMTTKYPYVDQSSICGKQIPVTYGSTNPVGYPTDWKLVCS